MIELVVFLAGAAVGAIAVTAWLHYATRNYVAKDPSTADDLAVADVRLDAEIYGVGYLRKRPEDGRLERVSPNLFRKAP